MARGKRGQVAIFVILALILVASIILFFTIERKVTTSVQEGFNAGAYIQQCAREYVDEAVELMLPQGGFIEPTNFRTYNKIHVAYLCENEGSYKGCVNQHPEFLSEMSREIENYAEPRIGRCFDNMKSEIEKRRGEVSYGAMDVNVSLAPDRVILEIEKSTTITIQESTQTINNYKVEVLSPLRELGRIANEIASQEARGQNCYFEYVGHNILYPKYKITPFMMSDGTAIYTIKDKRSGKELNIAIRSCAGPAGF